MKGLGTGSCLWIAAALLLADPAAAAELCTLRQITVTDAGDSRNPSLSGDGNALGFKNGEHLHCPDGTPLANLWLTQARAMGVQRDGFADSSGTLDSLIA